MVVLDTAGYADWNVDDLVKNSAIECINDETAGM